MRYKGFNFTKAPTVVTLSSKDNYVRFGRVSHSGAEGAEVTSWVHPQGGNPVWAVPVSVTGYSLTNMAFGADGKMYLAYDGRCYTAFRKSAEERKNERTAKRLQRDADVYLKLMRTKLANEFTAAKEAHDEAEKALSDFYMPRMKRACDAEDLAAAQELVNQCHIESVTRVFLWDQFRELKKKLLAQRHTEAMKVEVKEGEMKL